MDPKANLTAHKNFDYVQPKLELTSTESMLLTCDEANINEESKSISIKTIIEKYEQLQF